VSRRTRAVLAGATLLLASCILTSPVDVPALPLYPPTIVRGLVVPPAERPLATFPRTFVVPVRLLDPTARFQWRLFYDFESIRLSTGLQAYGTVEPDGSNVRELRIEVTPPEDVTRCHFVEVRVAYAFGGTDGNKALEPPGGDTVSWVYSPGGDLRGCPAFDAGAPLPAPEASTDGGIP
jgi:hypothetical protein